MYNNLQNKKLELIFLLDESELSKKAEEFAFELEKIIKSSSEINSSEIDISIEKNYGNYGKLEYDLNVKPAIILKNQKGSEIVYYGYPEGIERTFLLKIISKLFQDAIDINRTYYERIKRIGDVKFTVFVAPFCPHCANTVERLSQTVIINPRIKLMVVDITQFDELREKFRVVSVPVILINGKITLHGEKSFEELLEWAEKFGDENFIADYIVKMIREGKAEELSHAIVELENDEAIADLLTHQDFFVRLGAMFLLEHLFEKNKENVIRAKGKIIELLEHGDFRIREDAAMILGKIGDMEDVEILQKRLDLERGEVREAIQEAIQEIVERSEQKFDEVSS